MQAKRLFPYPRLLLIALVPLALLGVSRLWSKALHHSPQGPYIPRSNDTVVAKVPSSQQDPETRQRESLRKKLSYAPTDLPLAMEVARLDIAAARREADPRYLGYAEAALAPWWQKDHPPREVLVLRATIRQSRHDFKAALADLRKALTMDPMDPQAWLTQATVLFIQGRYAEAKASCDALSTIGTPLLTATCEAPILAMMGNGPVGTHRLESLLASSPQQSLRPWAHSVLGELWYWQGEETKAEHHLRLSLELDPSDRYTRATYADLLLDKGRALEVIRVLSPYLEDDNLLLRFAIARSQSGEKDATTHAQWLAERMAANQARGDRTHQREEARWALSLNNEPKRALDLALSNFANQREPWDARLVLEAALASGNFAAASPVLTWLAETGFLAPRLRALAEQIARAS
jgi:tetratricopeptide (TPR) repeat protein